VLTVAVQEFSPVCVTETLEVVPAAETERLFATSPTETLLDIAGKLSNSDRSTAYRTAKRANQLRVQHDARMWGARGARLVSVSPGIIGMADQPGGLFHHRNRHPGRRRDNRHVEVALKLRSSPGPQFSPAQRGRPAGAIGSRSYRPISWSNACASSSGASIIMSCPASMATVCHAGS